MGNFVMHELFPTICNMSLTASVVIVAVLLVRLLLRRAPKVFSYALWAVVLFRLICPVSVTSAVSLMGAVGAPVQERTQRTSAVEYVPADIVRSSGTPTVTTLPQETLPAINSPAESTVPAAVIAPEPAAALPLSGPMVVLTGAWLAGMALLLAYSAVSMLRLRRRLVGAVLLADNIYLADHIPSPFVMGLLRPKIYLPSTLKETERGYILRHEQYHIRRRDYLVKFLAFLALCVHWFNPLVWVAFVLAGKDMEMSCDEAVVKELGEDIRADYSASLLSLATGHRIVAGMPLAFGEGDTGGRIRNLLKWKRPRPWVIAVCAVVCVGLIALCAANPKGDSDEDPAAQGKKGQWSSVEAYVESVMNAETEVEYYVVGANGTVRPDEPQTAAVTDRKRLSLGRNGQVDGLDPDGTLEEWEFSYLVKFDADPESVALVGGQYYDDEGYFWLGPDNTHALFALHYEDDSYDILYDAAIMDGYDFYGYHNTVEEVIYDWYVTDQGLDLPLYVEDWIDQINYNNPNDKPGNYPVHRYDVDGGYLYIPISAWAMTDIASERASIDWWEWGSLYNTGSSIHVSHYTQSLEDVYTTSRKQGFEPLDNSKQIWKRRQDGINERYYFYPAADGNGCWRVWTLWTDLGISEYPNIFIEPQVLYLMAESFTPAADFTPAAGTATRTAAQTTSGDEVDGRIADITVGYTVEEEDGVQRIYSVDNAWARNFNGWDKVELSATVLKEQIIYLGGDRALVPVVYSADRGSGWKTFQAVVEISLTGQYSPRHALTQEELDSYNAITDPAVRDKSGDIVDLNIQPASYFLTSYYDNIRDLNFEEFIRYFPSSGKTSEAEFEALKKLDDWPFKWVENMADMPVPIQQHTVSSINEVLTRWGGITTNDLDTAGVCYLEKYDAYYTYTSDFNTALFAAESGQQIGDYVYLYEPVGNGGIAVLTLHLTAGTDEWQVVSHQRFDN